jgi:hypothetical protein
MRTLSNKKSLGDFAPRLFSVQVLVLVTATHYENLNTTILLAQHLVLEAGRVGQMSTLDKCAG